jgi:hypothetical protein
MMLTKLYLGLLALGGVLGAVVPVTHEVHEKREVLPPRWSKGSRVAAGSILPMRIGLTQNLDRAEEYLQDMYDEEIR